MGQEINLLDRYPTSKRPIDERGLLITDEHRRIAREFGHGYFDGDRLHGYGGYGYHPRFWTETVRRFRDFYHRRKAAFWDRPYREAASFQKAYLIHLFQDMIEQGSVFGHADTPGNYREIDTQEDLNLAQTLWKP